MSAMELRNFERQLDVLSYVEKLAVIEYLARSLQQANDGFSGNDEDRAKLDEAIGEFERGEYEVFNTFDDFKAAMSDD